jgi:hypothetical protein
MIEYRPSFPDGYRPGIAIVGCGQIVKKGAPARAGAVRSAERGGRPVSVAGCVTPIS